MLTGKQGLLIMMLTTMIISMLALNISGSLGWFVAVVLYLKNWNN